VKKMFSECKVGSTHYL